MNTTSRLINLLGNFIDKKIQVKKNWVIVQSLKF